MDSYIIFLLLLSNSNIFYYQAGSSPTAGEALPVQPANNVEPTNNIPEIKFSIDDNNFFNNIKIF